jgi:hypothetical protein
MAFSGFALFHSLIASLESSKERQQEAVRIGSAQMLSIHFPCSNHWIRRADSSRTGDPKSGSSIQNLLLYNTGLRLNVIEIASAYACSVF